MSRYARAWALAAVLRASGPWVCPHARLRRVRRAGWVCLDCGASVVVTVP